ncbi:MAG: type II toxin-antitoxin system HicA family toxin [Deltaproteobacteria bacterium]|nr:type II toxin-antitoxin system HicA family toxin [Deltaproteobacteria bacterium]
MKRRELESRLRALGWKIHRHGGRHDVWTRDGRALVVPRHAEIDEYTARDIMKKAGGKR